ncbi:MAG: sulfite exporter TauE/SafE family protein [Leptolyngbyaceae cyanobacterium T60_A2020_046]|nr:sulfite exporter TauE/SafE family protein [Leptolyngbyaceae cyanobacterium T60_A2020_046]
MLGVSDIALFAALGLTAGTLSGLFGIGGGMVIVPGLFYLFHLLALPEGVLMHLAAGTSMGIMIFTSAASTIAHHLKGDVQWAIVWRILPAIALGVALGKLFATHLNTAALELIFGLFLVGIAAKILLDWSPQPKEPKPPNAWLTNLVGTVLGLKSGVLGIGGGAISVPFLLYSGLSMSQASGTSASFTLPIAIVGTLSCLTFATQATWIPLATGTIYWPAVVMVAPFTMIGAPLGTQLCHWVPSARLKRWFAVFLLLLGLRLLGDTTPLL